MRLRRLIAADAVVLAVAAAVFAALFPSNVDSDETSPLYTAAFVVGVVALIALVALLLIALGTRFANRGR
jgi:hypothetical protein